MYPIDYSYNIKNRITSLGGAAFSSTKSLAFDGVDDYVETPAIFSLLDGLSNFAFSFWFKTSSFSYKQLFWIDGSSATANYAQTQLILKPNYLIWYFNNTGYYVYSNTTNPLVADTWYHVLCTRDDSRATGDKARIYINGVNESQYDSSRYLGTLDTSTSGLKIGDGDYRPPFSGNIDEFAVYNQDMAAYISEIYTGTPNDLSNLSTAPAPNVWYRMGENSTFKTPQILMPEQSNKDKVSNYSMAFDGVNDYVKAPLDGTSTGGILAAADADINLTISLWVKIDTSAATKGIFQWANALNSQFPLILIQQNSLEFRVYVDSGYRTAVTFSLDTWYNIVVTRNSSTNIWTGYLNGSSFFTYDDSGSLISRGNATDIYLGNGYNGYVDGKIDEVSIFNTTKVIGDIWDGTGQPTDLTGESGLVSWWRMGEEAVFNSTNWLLPNKAQDVFSRYSLEFDGVNDYVNCGNDSSLYPGTGDMSYSAWVNPNVLSGYQTLYGITGSATTVKHVNIELFGSEVRVFMGVGVNGQWGVNTGGGTGGASLTTSSSGLTIGEWAHVAVTLDRNGNGVIYINGVANVTAAMNPNDYSGVDIVNAANNLIGNGIGFVDGKIDEVAIFNSVKAIGDLWDGTGKPTDLTGQSGLVSWWRMGEDATFSTNWTVPDQIGSNTGTSANMTNDDLTGDAPGVTGNGTSANMTIEDRVGDAPDSENNSLSYNMDAADIVEETP
jgi:hypothetical protein